MNFLFISIGATGAMFTLREFNREGRTVQNFHHCNLGQDADQAWYKAVAYSLAMGVQLKTTKDEITAELREISRMKKDEREERDRRIKEQQDRYAAERAEHEQNLKNKIDSGIFPFGKYAGKKFEEAPKSYIRWVLEQTPETDTILAYLVEGVRKYSDVLSLEYADTFVGELNKRMDFEVKVDKSTGFWKDGFNGPEYVNVTTFVTDKNECIVVMSSSFSAKEGKVMKIRGTVKDHREYKGQKQTIINRVKEL